MFKPLIHLTDNTYSKFKLVSMILEPQRFVERRRFTTQASQVMRKLTIIVYTDRGAFRVENLRKRRTFYNEGGWGSRIVYGYNVEPWDNECFINVIVTLERFHHSDYWLAEVGLTGWYPIDVYAAKRLVLSKPQTGYIPGSSLSTLDTPIKSYVLLKLDVPTTPKPRMPLGSHAIQP